MSVYYLTRRYGTCSKCSLSSFRNGKKKEEKELEERVFNDNDNGEYKMVILIRNDLGMSKGKAVAQACHATLAAYKSSLRHSPSALKAWDDQGQPKVTLKVDSEPDLVSLIKRARSLNLVGELIRDAGRTQLEAGTRTVGAIGPARKEQIDAVTGHLKLY